MYDLHCHLLPSIDDGASDLDVALEMARMQVDQGVKVVACTPHILPGLYHNTGPDIKLRVKSLSEELSAQGIDLQIVAGADNHVTPQFVQLLQQGHLLAIGASRYVLVEPPHHIAPARLEDVFFELLVAGYVPILTHPERLTWIEAKYDVMTKLADSGVWMQITSGSLLGRFGKRAKYWAERMICEGRVHILASDAHDCERRPPDLGRGQRAAHRLVGAAEAQLLVATRPAAVLQDLDRTMIQAPAVPSDAVVDFNEGSGDVQAARNSNSNTLAGRLRRFFS
jgi:protein-tyrosine phosphatase